MRAAALQKKYILLFLLFFMSIAGADQRLDRKFSFGEITTLG